ncbi:MAG: hypothetical protein MR492_06440 [Clostridiales bacterium]|nr:hypothetical protein [Clostridiales bacterium]
MNKSGQRACQHVPPERKTRNPFIYTLMYSVIVIVAAQLNVKMFTEGFVISAGVIVFALLMLLLEEFAALPVIFLSAVGIMTLGVFETEGGIVGPSTIWEQGMPAFAFYAVYGIIVYLIFQLKHWENRPPWIFSLLIIPDFIANFIEMVLREGSAVIEGRIVLILIAAAVIRSALVLICYTIIVRYGFVVRKMPRSGIAVVDGKVKAAAGSKSDENVLIGWAVSDAAVLHSKLESANASAELLAKSRELIEAIEKEAGR